MNIFDPREIPQEEHPFLVSAGSSSEEIAEIIEFWDKSNIDHSMYSINKGTFTWQGMNNFYGERSMDKFLKKGGILKFYQLVNATPEFKLALVDYNQKRINMPPYKHLYNWLGIVGQMIGLHWISFPGLFFCSQVVIDGLKKSSMTLPALDQVIVDEMGNNMNPAALDKYWLANFPVFKLKYVWDSKTGVIV